MLGDIDGKSSRSATNDRIDCVLSVFDRNLIGGNVEAGWHVGHPTTEFVSDLNVLGVLVRKEVRIVKRQHHCVEISGPEASTLSDVEHVRIVELVLEIEGPRGVGKIAALNILCRRKTQNDKYAAGVLP